jgi:hypothetical protein
MRFIRRHTAKVRPRHFSRPSLAPVFCRAPSLTHGKDPMPCVRQKEHDNGPLPCKKLSCSLCRAFPRKTQSKNFVVRFVTFVVRFERTANLGFPVV